jgi:hypothetical protein
MDMVYEEKSQTTDELLQEMDTAVYIQNNPKGTHKATILL